MAIAGTLEVQLMADVARIKSDMEQAKNIVGGAMAGMERSIGLVRNALGALGVGLSVGALTAWARAVADGIDALNDLKDATGASIENLSALEDIARRTGTSFDTAGTALVKFNASLSSAKAGTEAAEVYKRLGLNVADLKKQDPAEAMRQVAVALSTMADDGNKARAVQELFGKSLREVAPLLNDLAKAGKLNATVTTEQAEEAEKFNNQLNSLRKNSEDAARSLVSNMLPALNSILDLFNKKGLGAAINEFGNQLLDWEGNAARKAIARLTEDVATAQKRVNFNTFVSAADKALLNADLANARQALEAAKKDYFKLTDVQGGRGSVNPALVDARGSIGDLGDPKAINKELAEQAKILAELSGLTGSFAEDWDRLNRMYRAGSINLEQLTKLQKALLDNQPAIKKAADERAQAMKLEGEAAKALLDVQREIDEQWSKDHQERTRVAMAISDQTRALEDQAAQLQLEKTLIGATDRERATALGNLRIEIELRKKLDELDHNLAFNEEQRAQRRADLIKNAEREKQLVQESEALRENINILNAIDQTARSVWTNVFDGGSNAFKKLGETLKAAVLDLLYQMTLKKWIISIGASVTGGMASAGSGGALGSGGDGILGSVLSGIGGLGGSVAAGAGWLTGATTLGGSLSAATSLIGAGGAGILPGLGMMMGALGPIALGVAALVSIFGDEKGGPKVINSAGAGYDPIGDTGAVSQSIDGLVSAYSMAAQRLGITPGQLTAGLLVSSDPEGDALSAVANSVYLNGGLVYDRENALQGGDAYKNVARGAEEEAVAESLARGLLAALKNSQLPQRLQSYFDTLDPLQMSAEQVQAAIDAASSAQAVWSAFEHLGPAFERFANLSVQAAQNVIEMAGGLEAFNAQAASYAANFLTEDERNRMVAQNISGQLAGVGLNYGADQILHATREEFRRLMEGFAAIGGPEADAAVAVLFKVNEAFASIVPATEELADEVSTLERATWDAASRVDGYTEALERQNASIAAHAAFMNQIAGVTERNLANAVAAAQQGVADARNNLTAAYEREAGVLQDVIDKNLAWADSLKQAQQALWAGPNSPLSGNARMLAARSALGGINPENAAGLVGNYLDAFRPQARSQLELIRETAKAGALLREQEGVARAKASEAQQQIDGMKALVGSVDALQTTLTFTNALLAVRGAEGRLGIAQLNQQGAGAGAYDALLQNMFAASGMTAAQFNQWASAALNLGVEIDGSHAGGLDRVPFDGYRAELHAGERVKTASAARAEDGMVGLLQSIDARLQKVESHAAKSQDDIYRLRVAQDKKITGALSERTRETVADPLA